RTAAEAAREALHAGKTDPVDLCRIAVEYRDTRILEDGLDLLLPVGLAIVIAQYRDRGDLESVRHLARERSRFVRQAEVGQIARDDEDVRGIRDLREQRLQRALHRRLAVMEIA